MSRLTFASGRSQTKIENDLLKWDKNEGINLKLFNDKKTYFSFDWLRDNCLCESCVHPQTKQKLHTSGEVKQSLTPEKVNYDGQTLKVLWPKNSLTKVSQSNYNQNLNNFSHESTWSTTWLKHNCYQPKFDISSDKNISQIVLWNGDDYEKVRNNNITYERLFNDSVTYRHMLEFLSKYGLVFITEIPSTEVNAVEKIAELIGPIRETFYGRTWDVKNDPKSENIAYTSLPIGFHMDLLYFECPPGLQFLHCIHNSAKGGVSAFLDGYNAAKILREIDPESYKDLSEIRMKYHYKSSSHNMVYEHTLINTSNISDLPLLYYSPQFQAPIIADKHLLSAYYKSIRVWEFILSSQTLAYRELLKEGTCVAFVNRRILHARDAFDSSSGERLLRGTYVDWDCLKDKIRMHL